MGRSRLTLKDLAAAAGVSRSTASRAMRGDRRLSERTIARVRAIAADIGYVADPQLSALVDYRRGARPPGRGRHLALVVLDQPGRPGEAPAHAPQVAASAASLASPHPIRWTTVPIRRDGGNAGDLEVANDLEGLVVVGALDDRLPDELGRRLDRLPIVVLNHRGADHRYDVVIWNSVWAMRRGCDHLHGLGCRRIGLALDPKTDDASDGHWSMAFRDRHARVAPGEPAPILPVNPQPGTRARIAAWIADEGIDGLITAKPGAVLDHPAPERRINLLMKEDEREGAGFVHDWRRLLATAVEVLDRKIALHRCGPTEPPTVISVCQRFRANGPGRTAPT